MIRTLFVTTVVFAYLVLVGIPLLLYTVLTRDSEPLYRFGIWGCRVALRLAGIRLDIRGQERIPAGRAVVFMANHQSMCDPPAVISSLPPARVLLKKSLFRVPILGTGMKLRGFVPVDRRNREQAIRAVDQAVEALRQGHSFLVYPEGTRSPDGRLLPFKKGAFVMALKAQVPIVPMSVSGASRIMRKGEMAIHPGPLRITFHPPIPTQGYSLEHRGVVMELVRMAVISGLTENEWPAAFVAPVPAVGGIHGIASGGRHEVALAHGFSRADVDGEFVIYQHPQRGILHTFNDGSWTFVASDGRETSGTGAEELRRLLSGEASGPAKPH
jgi:1-acyl-sn-glycerol-3-phosphate acyltransferase